MKKWLIGIGIFLFVLACGGTAFYFLYWKKRPKVSTGMLNGYVIDSNGTVTLHGTVVGKDNGDDSYTAFTGAIVTYDDIYLGQNTDAQGIYQTIQSSLPTNLLNGMTGPWATGAGTY